MSDTYDDALPHSSFWSSYMLGQQHHREQQDFDNFIQRHTGRAPVARGDYDALLAQYESVVDYANQLVQRVDALRQQNATLSEDYRRLREWAVKAEARRAEDDQACRELAATANAQTSQIARLTETIEELETELAELRTRSVRTD